MKIDFIFVGTEIFSRVADFYEKHGCYCLEPDDSPNAVKFWQREMIDELKVFKHIVNYTLKIFLLI